MYNEELYNVLKRKFERIKGEGDIDARRKKAESLMVRIDIFFADDRLSQEWYEELAGIAAEMRGLGEGD